MNKNKIALVLAHAFLIMLLIIVLVPYVAAVLNSFRFGNLITSRFIPERFSLEHWKEIFGIAYTNDAGEFITPHTQVIRWLLNSLQVSTLTTTLCVFLSSLFAFALYLFNFGLKKYIILSTLYIQLFSGTLSLIAFYVIFQWVGDIFPSYGLNSYLSLASIYVSGISFTIWLLYGYINTTPHSLYEAATIDGAGAWSIYWRVMLPLITPMLMVAFILSFMGQLTEFPVANIILTTENKITLGVGLQQLLEKTSLRWGDFSAAAVLAGAPVSLAFIFLRNKLESIVANSSGLKA